jgi:hypothetical protein
VTRSAPFGWLFLLQLIAAFGLAAAVPVSGSRLAAAAGAGFALSTLGGYLLSVWIGLFGFKEIRDDCGDRRRAIEVAAFAALAVLALSPAAQRQAAGPVASRSAMLARRTSTSAAFQRGDDLVLGERSTRQRPGTVNPGQAGLARSTATGGGEGPPA